MVEKKDRNGTSKKLPKALRGYSGGRLPGRNTEEKGREEGEEVEGSEQRQEKNETIEEVIKSSQRMAFEECCISERKWTEGPNPIQRWDCSQIENEEEEESWQEGNQMAGQWEEEQHLEERRRVEGSSFKLDVMQKVPELVVKKRMSKGEKGERHERKEESARMVH